MAEVSDEPEKVPAVVVADNVTVLPSGPKPRPTRRPAGAFVWLVLLAVPAALEVVALLVRQFGWTLSHAVWWAEGPVGERRWWLLALPIFAFLQWVAFHFLIGPRVDGWVLLGAVVVAFAIGVGAVLLS